MKTHRAPLRTAGAALVLAALALAGCGGSDLTIGATPTVTSTAAPTATATPQPNSTVGAAATATSTALPTAATPAAAAVRGLIAVGEDVRGDTKDGLSPLPPEMVPPGFDRGLGGADWIVDDGSVAGTTTADGRFSITGLTPGAHVLRVTKTVEGNLLALQLPIVVGDDGSAEVVAEVLWGQVRTLSTYRQGGADMQAVFAPNGSHLITRGGRVLEIGDYSRTLVDADGDGHFDARGCDAQLYACGGPSMSPVGDPTTNSQCGPDKVCSCIPSCPFCDDCRAQVCLALGTMTGLPCTSDGQCKGLPYACSADGTCSQPGDTCACVAPCPGCEGCDRSICVPTCAPTVIVALAVTGPERLVAGQTVGASAVATFSDGTAMDVTWLASWTSSEPDVASVDTWGRIRAIAVGVSDIAAGIADVTSPPLALTVVDRPTLRHIYVQNASCYYPPSEGVPPIGPVPPVMPGDVLPPPSCGRVVRIGATIQFVAVGEFDTGSYADVSGEVEWRVDPSALGDVVKGLFTAQQAGAGQLSARLGAVESDAVEIRVVTEPTVVALSIYPLNYAMGFADGDPAKGNAAQPCVGCGGALALLRGDVTRFAATAQYDTGEWADVSGQVTWRSSDSAVAPIDATGVLTAAQAGDASIDASFGGVTSAPTAVHVVDTATLLSLSAYQEGSNRAIGKGEQSTFRAMGYYDVGFTRDVTEEATWRSSDEQVGRFDAPGTFTGLAAGSAMVWAELAGQQTTPLPIEVYATSDLTYCDPASINRSVWSDDFNRVTLESDCAEYTPPAVVALRFSVTETQMRGGIFDPCLDLYAYRGDTLVRTIRQEGCGDPFLPADAPGRADAVLKYQLAAFWDLKDDAGQTVAPGTYTIRGRFYLYYDPVVKLAIEVRP